jgi:SAM-dependent methyltransferase
MIEDRIRWNQKYRSDDYPKEPSGIVQDFWRLAPGRRALDLAAGCGRNALFLARSGFVVDAVDISDVGLGLLANRQRAIRPICADLDTFDIPPGRYDLIVDILYLNRRLFPQIREGLAPRGLLIFETLLTAPASAAADETRREYLLQENELLHAFLGLRIIHYHEETGAAQGGHKRLASLVAARG